MEKIKTVCTGTITPDFMAKLNECCDITMGGYAVTGLNTMPEDELIDLLKGAGVDMSTTKPVEEALSLFGELIGEMEELMKD